MVNRVVPDAELMPEALRLAEKLAAVSRPAMAETKRLFYEVADLPLAEALERGRDANKRMRNFAEARQEQVKPLEHLTILDLSRVLACPFASMILAELGARVIKVEQPGSGDETRGFEPQLAQRQRLLLRLQPLQGIDHRQPALATRAGDHPRARAARPTC